MVAAMSGEHLEIMEHLANLAHNKGLSRVCVQVDGLKLELEVSPTKLAELARERAQDRVANMSNEEREVLKSRQERAAQDFKDMIRYWHIQG